MNQSEQSTYKSYLLRLWYDDQRLVWRAWLQSTATEQIYHFVEADRMWAFLQAQMADVVDDQKIGNEPPPNTSDQ
jgi:hypothetical protein